MSTRTLLATAISILAVYGLLATSAPARGQDAATAIGIDADPTGNTATSLGRIDSCVEVSAGTTFQVDLFIQNVNDLLAWEAYLQTDPETALVADRDVELFQAANPGSDILDGSEQTPDSDGLYRLSAVDTSDPATPDSGSGVLARITLEAVGGGISPLRLDPRDLDGNGTPDQGPFLRNVEGDIIGDDTGDSIFDGKITDAEVAIDQNCPPKDGSGGLDWEVIVAVVAVGIASVALVGFAARWVRRRTTAS